MVRNPANQLRLVVYPSIFSRCYTSLVVGLGISEPSTESYCLSGTPGPHDSTQIFACGANLQCCHAYRHGSSGMENDDLNIWVTCLLSGSPKIFFKLQLTFPPRDFPLSYDILQHLYMSILLETPINIFWSLVSTHLKNICRIGSFPQVGMKIKNI